MEEQTSRQDITNLERQQQQQQQTETGLETDSKKRRVFLGSSNGPFQIWRAPTATVGVVVDPPALSPPPFLFIQDPVFALLRRPPLHVLEACSAKYSKNRTEEHTLE